VGFPEAFNGDLGPFLESIGQVKDHLASAITLARDPEKRKLFEDLLARLEKGHEEFEATVPQAFQDAKAEFQKIMTKKQELLKEQEQLFAQIAQIKQKAVQATETGKARRESAARKPKAVPLRPVKLAKDPPETPLSEGAALRDFLLAKDIDEASKKSSQPTIGNIWEKWTPGDPHAGKGKP